ncbi:hypothetical protein GT347_20620 [Xylophilus rhododendri]|uniref:Glycosyltransferase 2-like domain-containing protein n=1 Tax=Xylophilus rhododendri TaxID=2697032 RepID=A0A857JAU2_9BURK|nr:glycosyltransferase [Xylophilus rhododendri]QHJ00170.1 hypothetical protein GT347_20620 [Xylophilus rhododendri]
MIRALKSLLDQTEKPEIIVVDGASRDNTVPMIWQHFSEAQVKNSIRAGLGSFRRMEQRRPHGFRQWLIFIGADDYMRILAV